MIDRRTVCVGAAATVFAARGDVAVAMPNDSRLGQLGELGWTYVQQLPPPVSPLPIGELKDQKAISQYLKDGTYNRIAKAGISIEDDARPEIDQAIERSADAIVREKKGEIRRGNTLDALTMEVRRVVVLRNLNTFVDVLIIVSWEQGKKLTKEVVNRVQGFLCPLYPICTG